jgi:hypothetical protein
MGTYTNGVYAPAIGESGWGDEVNDFLTRSGEREYNVKAAPYGAVGDGVTDDWAAITACLAAADAGDGTVFFPPGYYKVTSTIDLGGMDYQHIVGGHINAGLIQFDRAPQVVIDGSSIASGPTLSIDGLPSGGGGIHTVENITFLGNETALKVEASQRNLFLNCGFKAVNVTGTADNCAVLLLNLSWNEWRSCTMHAPNAGVATVPSVIMRGDNTGPDAQSAGGTFRDCVFIGETWIEQNTPYSSAGPQYWDCITEASGGAFLRVREGAGVTSGWTRRGIIFVQGANADSVVPDCPLIVIEAAHFGILDALFMSSDTVAGHKLIRRDVAHYSDPYYNGLRNINIIGGGESLVVDGAGLPTGGTYVTKRYGFDIHGGPGPDVTSTDTVGGQGPAIRLAQLGETNARLGLDTDGSIYWGQGGVTGTWDTKLYRSAADTLKTDDALTVALALTAQKATIHRFVALTDAATVAVDASLGTHLFLQTSNSRTIGAPTNPVVGQELVFYIKANAGGITTTWEAAYHRAGAWVDPANGKYRTITFAYVTQAGLGNLWIEVSRAAADIT